MTFAELEINPTIMRESNQDYFSNYTDDDLLEMSYKTVAKEELKQDLCSIFGWKISNSADMSTLDTLINDYQTDFQTCLMYLQLFYYFQNLDEGDGSKTNTRMNFYRTKYKEKLTQIQNFKVGEYNRAISIRMKRG